MLRNVKPVIATTLNTLAILNEVLSLNAQESETVIFGGWDSTLLNEVLSLNAQELVVCFLCVRFGLSSMKS